MPGIAARRLHTYNAARHGPDPMSSRRQRAPLLPVGLLLASCAGLGGSPGGGQGSRSLLRQGWEFLAADRFDPAIACFEQVASTDPENGEARLGLGRAREGLLASRPIAGREAGEDYLEAIRLLPADPRPRLGAARIAFLTGETEEAALRAIEARALAEAAGAEPEQFEANVLLARATLRQILASPPGAVAALRRRADAAIDRSTLLEPGRPEPYELGAELAASTGDFDAQRAHLRRGVQTCPEADPLHEKLRAAWGPALPGQASSLLEAYESLVSLHPDSPATRWYLGLARRADADARRAASDWGGAEAGYAAASEAFGRTAALDPSRKEAAEEAAAATSAASAWCRLGAEDLPAASRLFLEALRRFPALLGRPDPLGKTPREGIERICDAWTSRGELDPARDLVEEALALCACPPEWSVRLARLCRDTATEAEAAREGGRARSLYEKSFAAYSRALGSLPEDPRVLVEGAAVLLHHLGRDDARAEEMLRRACEIGERALAEPSLPVEERDALSGAVGDAYEHLGVLFHDRRADPQTARSFFEKSLQHAPRPRPRVRWYLGKIEGGSGTAASSSSPLR